MIEDYQQTLDEILNRYSVLDNKDKSYFLHAKGAKGAKFYSLWCFTLALEGSQTPLRQESAKQSV